MDSHEIAHGKYHETREGLYLQTHFGQLRIPDELCRDLAFFSDGRIDVWSTDRDRLREYFRWLGEQQAAAALEDPAPAVVSHSLANVWVGLYGVYPLPTRFQGVRTVPAGDAAKWADKTARIDYIEFMGWVREQERIGRLAAEPRQP